MATTPLRSTLAERAAANPLPAHGACVLGSLNVAVRMLDDAGDLSLYPLALEESVLSPSANGCRAPLRYRL